jgi:hypothetical protein
MAKNGYRWLQLAASGCAILADLRSADKGADTRIPRLCGVTAGGMGIALVSDRHRRRHRGLEAGTHFIEIHSHPNA